MKDRGNKPGTINTRLQRIRAFLNYLVEQKILPKNVASSLKLLRDDVKINVFTNEQVILPKFKTERT